MDPILVEGWSVGLRSPEGAADSWMGSFVVRMSRAYIAGIGTTGVIVAATLLLLAVVSALVAFRGLPEQDAPDQLRAYIVDDPSEPPETGSLARFRDAVTAAAAAVGAAGDPARATPAARSIPSALAADARAADGGGALRTKAGPARVTPSAPPDGDGASDVVAPAGEDGTPDAPQPGPGSAQGDGPPRGIEALSNTLGDTSDRLTTDIGTVLAPISPALGAQVQTTGDALAEQIRQLGLSR